MKPHLMIGFKRHCTSALLVSSLCVWPTWSSTDSYAQSPLSIAPGESLHSASLTPRRPKPEEPKEEEDGKEASEEETKQQLRSNRAFYLGPCIGIDMSCLGIGGKFGYAGSHYGIDVTASILTISSGFFLYSPGESGRAFTGIGFGWFWDDLAFSAYGGVELKGKYLTFRPKLTLQYSLGRAITWDAGTLFGKVHGGVSFSLMLRLPWEKGEFK